MKIGIAVRRNDTDYFVHRSYINLLKIIKLFTQNDKSYGMLTVAQQH